MIVTLPVAVESKRSVPSTVPLIEVAVPVKTGPPPLLSQPLVQVRVSVVAPHGLTVPVTVPVTDWL